MKAFKSLKFSAFTISMLAIAVVCSTANAQENDDMYFNKSDRKTVKQNNVKNLSKSSMDNSNYKEISESTETHSAKNVNPEYIAKYKSSESDQNQDAAYSDKDYFVEGYNDEYVSDSEKGNIDYDALAKRDQMSASKYNNSNSSWGFNPSMSMGFGSPYYGRYGYDPFMMGYGSGLSMSYGFGSGFGYPMSAMAFSVGMSWGSGYNSWGGYPGYYSPYGMNSLYGMRGYDPWNMYGYNAYSRYGYSPYYGSSYRYGGYNPTMVIINNTDNNGNNISYKPRTTRASVNQRTINSNAQSSTSNNIRIPNNTDTSPTSNGRISTRDYSKAQNEYYGSSRARQNSSSVQRIATTEPHRRSSSSASFNNSSISNNKPSRISNYSSGTDRSSTYSNYNRGTSRSSSSNSFSTPSRSSSSFSSGDSGSRSSSYSSGSSSGTSYGSRSSSSSRSSR